MACRIVSSTRMVDKDDAIHEMAAQRLCDATEKDEQTIS